MDATDRHMKGIYDRIDADARARLDAETRQPILDWLRVISADRPIGALTLEYICELNAATAWLREERDAARALVREAVPHMGGAREMANPGDAARLDDWLTRAHAAVIQGR